MHDRALAAPPDSTRAGERSGGMQVQGGNALGVDAPACANSAGCGAATCVPWLRAHDARSMQVPTPCRRQNGLHVCQQCACSKDSTNKCRARGVKSARCQYQDTEKQAKHHREAEWPQQITGHVRGMATGGLPSDEAGVTMPSNAEELVDLRRMNVIRRVL